MAKPKVRKRQRKVAKARRDTQVGPVTVTNTRTGEVTVWEPYTPAQLAALDPRVPTRRLRQPRRKRA